MSRPLSAEMLAALAEGHVSIALFFEGEFNGGTVNLWTGIGPIDYAMPGRESATWTGAGDLLGITPVEETAEVKAAGINIALSGVSPANITLALSEMRRRAPGIIWLALMSTGAAQSVTLGDDDDEVGDDDDVVGAGTDQNEIIPNPVVWFRGKLDASVIEDGEQSATIRISYENELITLETPRELRYTSEEQKRLYPGDLGCDFIAGMQDLQLHWGQRE